MSSYGGSVKSATSKFSLINKLERTRTEGSGQGDDIIDQRSSLEYGIFGVLFTLSKERSEARIRSRWAFLKLMLDGWQLFTCIINPERQGWSINASGTAWEVVAVLNFTWLADLGYGAYLAVLYSMLALLAVNVIMCVWVAWCFKEHKFPVVWPIKVLRVFSSLFFQAFDVTSLNLLQLGFSCRFTGPEKPHLHFTLFPEYSCMTTPHLVHAVVSALCLVLFVGIALLLNMAEVEVNPLSRRPLALGHSGADVWTFGIKVLLTLVNVFFGWRRVEAAIYLGLTLSLAYLTLKWNSNLVAWMNYVKGGVSLTTVWCSFVLMMLVFRSDSNPEKEKEWADRMTLLLLVGLAPAFGTGALISWAVIRHKITSALKAVKNPNNLPLMDAFYNIDEPRDVEVAARCCRVWKDSLTLDPVAVNSAHQIVKAGVEMFPNSAYMVLLHGNFMIDVLGISQSGSRRIEEARNMNPSLMCRFIMFVRQQQATQNAAQSSVNSSSRMDLLGYVEYQRKQRMVVRLHREALQAMCSFWKVLDSHTISFTRLSTALSKIESSVSQAQRAYQVVLQSYGNNPKLVFLYGKFLQSVKNDPWHAAAYIAEAERLEELQAGQESGPMMPDGTPLSRMDDLATAVLVMDTAGDVQMANKHAHALFGYKRGSLEGKPLAALLAPHIAPRLAKRLAALSALHKETSEEVAPEEGWDPLGELVVGLHPDRLAFKARLELHKVAGIGEDSTIVAIVEPILPTKGVASLWVTQGGLITACDGAFVAQFGWKASEVTGINIQALVSGLAPDSAGTTCLPGDDTCGVQQTEASPAAAGTPNKTASANSTMLMARLLSGSKPAAEASGDGVGAIAQSQQPAPGGVGLTCRVPHKYMKAPLPCEVGLVFNAPAGGTANASSSSPITAAAGGAAAVCELSVRILATEPVQLLAVNRKGAILHASPELATYLLHGGSDSEHPHSPAGHHHLGGLHGGLTRAGAGGSTHDALADYSITDFLSPAWRDLHSKLIRDVAAMSGISSVSAQQSAACRKSALPGPTLELRTAGGKELYMRVGVLTSDVQGEMIHVVQLERSSLEAALAERRLRLRLSPDGLIAGVETGSPSQLFGMETAAIVGRGLWEILDGVPVMEGDPPGVAGPKAVTRFIDRSLLQPGHSWRAQVVQPPGSGRGKPMRAQNPKAAIIQVEPSPSAIAGVDGEDGDDGGEGVLVDLWPTTSVVGVLELDPFGRIRAILEERSRPAGLLFGVPSSSLVGSMLGELVELPHGFSKPEDLLSATINKKSSLKSRSREASVKVGPVHVLRVTHHDGTPLKLDVQVVGKPGSTESSIAILKLHPTPMMPRRLSTLQQPFTAGAPSAAAAAPGSPQVAGAGAAPTTRSPAALLAKAENVGGLRLAAAAGAAAASEPAGGVGAGLGAGAAGVAASGRGAGGGAAPTLLAPSASLTLPPEDSSATMPAASSLRDPPLSQPPGGDAGAATVFDSLLGVSSAAEPLLLRTPSTPTLNANRAAGGGGAAQSEEPPSPSPAAQQPDAGGLLSEAPSGIAGLKLSASLELPGLDKLALMVQSLGEDNPASSRSLLATAPRPSFHACPRPRSRAADQAAAAARVQDSAKVPDTPHSLEVERAEVPGTVMLPPAGSSPQPKAETLLPVDDVDVGSESAFAGALDNVDETSIDKIYKWVATKGAYYQNSDPGAGNSRSSGLPALLNFDIQSDAANGRRSSAGGAPAVAKSPLSKTTAAADGPADAEVSAATGPAVPPLPDESEDGSAEANSAPGCSDEAGSEGGRSGMSESQSASGSEYTRGKRVRKLAKLMDSSEARQVQKRLRIHTQVIVAILAAAHIACFALTVLTVKAQRTTMLQLGRSSLAQLDMHKVMIAVRTLDNIAIGNWNPNVYTPEKATFLIKDIGEHAEEAMMLINDVLAKHSGPGPVRDLLYHSKLPVWDSIGANGTDVYTNITILDFATRFYAMAKNVEQSHASWVQGGTRIAKTTPGQFLLKSGPDYFEEFTLVMEALLDELVDSSRFVEHEQVIFLVVEGAVLSVIAACYIAYLLRTVAAQRCKLYSIFLGIPLGLTRALASQSTHLVLDGDDDSEDDDDEEDKASQVLTAQQFDDNGGDQKLRRRAKLKVQQETAEPPNLKWDDGKRRPHGRSSIAGPGGAAGSTSGRSGGADDRDGFRSKQLNTGDDGAKSGDLTAGGSGCWGWLTMVLRQRLWSRSMSNLSGRFAKRVNIHPTPQYLSGAGGALSFSESGSKRKLVLDTHETTMMLLAFVLWSALVIAIYAAAVGRLQGVSEVVALHSVANFVATRTARTVFFSQELMSAESVSELPMRRANLAASIKLLRDVWFTLQLGSEAYLSIGNDTERFPMVTGGLASSSPELLHMLYNTGTCYRMKEHLPCPGPEYRFYKIVYGSLASMGQQYMMSLRALVTNTSAVLPERLQDENFDFIYNVGYSDLMDGAIKVKDAHAEAIITKFDIILVLHIVLFLLFWAIFAVFLSFQLKPLLKRFAEERRRVAELMAQLPLELDVERLVSKALGVAGATANNGSGYNNAPRTSQGGPGGSDGPFHQSMAGDGGGAHDFHAEGGGGGISKWKAIIRASSSLKQKTSSDGRKKA